MKAMEPREDTQKEAGIVRRLPQFGEPKTSVRAWVRMLRISDKVERVLAHDLRERWGLSVAQFDVLTRVGANEGLTQGQLADSLLVTKGNVAQMVEKMERKGLITRRPQGRSNRLYLTEEGRKLHEQIVPAHEALVDQQFSELTEEEQQTLLEILRKLNKSLT